MSISTRKLVGTILLLIFLTLYAAVMFVVGTALVVNTSSQWAALAFYALAGFGWVVPAGWILRWILKPLRLKEQEDSKKD